MERHVSVPKESYDFLPFFPCYHLFCSSSKSIIFEPDSTLIGSDYLLEHPVSKIKVRPCTSTRLYFLRQIFFFIIEKFSAFGYKLPISSLIFVAFFLQINAGLLQTASSPINAVAVILRLKEVSDRICCSEDRFKS